MLTEKEIEAFLLNEINEENDPDYGGMLLSDYKNKRGIVEQKKMFTILLNLAKKNNFAPKDNQKYFDQSVYNYLHELPLWRFVGYPDAKYKEIAWGEDENAKNIATKMAVCEDYIRVINGENPLHQVKNTIPAEQTINTETNYTQADKNYGESRTHGLFGPRKNGGGRKYKKKLPQKSKTNTRTKRKIYTKKSKRRGKARRNSHITSSRH